MKPAREERWGKAGFWWGIWKQLPGNTNHKGPEPHWKPSQSDQMMDLERFVDSWLLVCLELAWHFGGWNREGVAFLS